MANHHPMPELLADYASGAMALSHSLCVAAHLEFCGTCRHHISKLVRVGTHYFESLPVNTTEVSENEDLKGRVFAMLDEPEPEVVSDDEFAGAKTLQTNQFAAASEFPVKSLGQFIKNGYEELAWSRVSPSIKLTTLLRDKDGAQIALSRTSPGGRMPHHSHTGDEITVVLEGSFSDESGVYRRGDFIFRDAKDKHTPVVTRDAECICLMVLDAPIQFTGFFTRWLNPLVRKHHAES